MSIDFRKIIRSGLDKKKLSINKLARISGVMDQSIYDYMAGRSELVAKNLEKVLTALEVVIPI